MGNRSLPVGSAVRFGVTALLGVVLGCLHPSAAPVHAAKRPSEQVDTFEHVWRRVGESFPDPSMNGVDWQQVHDSLLPRAQEARTADDLRPILREMLDAVGVSHFAILPGRVYRGSAHSGPMGDLGLDAALVEGHVHVVSVRADGGAERAGIRPGDQIVAIGDTVLDDVLAELTAEGGVRRPAAIIGSLMRELTYAPMGEGCSVRLVRTSADGTRREDTLSVLPGPLQGEIFKMGEMPATLVETQSRVDDPDGPDGPIPPVLVVRFSMFAVPSAAAVRSAVMDAHAQGVSAAVVDLRGNPGGMLDVARGLAGHFVARKSASLGTFRTRDATLELSIRPRVSAERLDGPLAVVVDGRSASSSEVFASGMQDLGRATIVGEQSSGLALMSAFESLPNGDRMQFVFADLVSPAGKHLEGVGVTPDLVVAPTVAALHSQADPALDAALAKVRKELTP